MSVAEDYIPLARSLTKKYTPNGQNFRDSGLLSVAYEALAVAANKLDDRSEGRTSYIKTRIEGALKRELTERRTNGFTGLRRSKYTRAILMDTDTEIPEELRLPLTRALKAGLSINEPTTFEDGETGPLEEKIDAGVPSLEDECIAHERQHYIETELDDWERTYLEGLPLLYFQEVMRRQEKSQAQFCRDHHIHELKARDMRVAIEEEFAESASYIWHNLEDM